MNSSAPLSSALLSTSALSPSPQSSAATGAAPVPSHDRLEDLDGCALIYFGNDWSAENRTSSHHIARRLASNVPLLYVDSPGMRAPTASGRDLKKIARKLRQAVQLPTPIGPHFWRSTVPQLPFRSVPGVGWLNQRFARWALARAIRHLGLKRYLLWFALPHPGFLAGKLGELGVVYYCIDDYAAHPGVDAASIQQCDDALTRVADRVFVAPPALLEAKRRLNPSTLFSPHGVDADLFARASNPETVAPAILDAVKGPIIGFFGSLADWVDVSLIARLARERPEYTLLLVGHVSTDVSELRGLANVMMVGAQPYESLPEWAAAFDVAIIPYRLNRQVMNSNPLKLREYLATGKPVVSVSTPEVDRFGEFVNIAANAEEFLLRVDQAVADKDPMASQRRMQSVAATSWDARVSETISVVRSDVRKLSSKFPGEQNVSR